MTNETIASGVGAGKSFRGALSTWASGIGGWLLLGGLLVHGLFLVSLQTHLLDPLFVEAARGYGHASDYFGIYQAGQNLADGLSIYDSENYRSEAAPRVPYFYFYRYLPPTAYFAALDARLLSPWPAYWVWVLCNELLLGLFLVLLLRTPAGTLGRRQVLAALTLAFTPFYLEQFMGQFSFLMAVFLWFPLRAELLLQPAPEERGGMQKLGRLLRRWEFWAWSAAIALKSFPALFAIPYLRQGRQLRVWCAATAVVLVCLPYFWSRPEDLRYFAHLNLRPLPPEIELARFGMVGLLQAASAHLLGPRAFEIVTIGPKPIFLSSVAVYLWIAAILATSLIVTWRARQKTMELLALWTITFFCVYKDVWEYHHVMLLPVLFTLALRYRSTVPVLVLALLALPTPFALLEARFGTVAVPQWPLAVILLHYGSKALVVLALFSWTVRRCLADGPDGATSAIPRAARERG